MTTILHFLHSVFMVWFLWKWINAPPDNGLFLLSIFFLAWAAWERAGEKRA